MSTAGLQILCKTTAQNSAHLAVRWKLGSLLCILRQIWRSTAAKALHYMHNSAGSIKNAYATDEVQYYSTDTCMFHMNKSGTTLSRIQCGKLS